MRDRCWRVLVKFLPVTVQGDGGLSVSHNGMQIYAPTSPERHSKGEFVRYGSLFLETIIIIS